MKKPLYSTAVCLSILALTASLFATSCATNRTAESTTEQSTASKASNQSNQAGGDRADSDQPQTETTGAQSDSSGDQAESTGTPIEERIERAVSNYGIGGEYVVLFSQDGEYHPVESNRVTLQPTPFTIHVVATDDMAAMVHISTDPSARDAVLAGRQPEHPIGSPATGMAIEPRNQQRQLMVDPIASNVWNGPGGESEHDFERVDVRDRIFVGHRRIENITNAETGETTPLEEAAGMELHFVEFQPVADDTTRTQAPGRAYTVAFEN